MTPRCLQCRYQRDGLADGLPCPECGTLPPPKEWIVLFGSQSEWNPWWAVGAAGAMVAVGLMLLGMSWRLRTYAMTAQGFALAGMGTVVFLRALFAARRVPDGGDVVWVIKPDEIECRGMLGTASWRWSELGSALYELGWRPNSVQLSISTRQSLDQKGCAIWLNSKSIDTRAIHAELRARIAAASATQLTEAARGSDSNSAR